jgi:hypothetical protein
LGWPLFDWALAVREALGSEALAAALSAAGLEADGTRTRAWRVSVDTGAVVGWLASAAMAGGAPGGARSALMQFVTQLCRLLQARYNPGA